MEHHRVGWRDGDVFIGFTGLGVAAMSGMAGCWTPVTDDAEWGATLSVPESSMDAPAVGSSLGLPEEK